MSKDKPVKKVRVKIWWGGAYWYLVGISNQTIARKYYRDAKCCRRMAQRIAEQLRVKCVEK